MLEMFLAYKKWRENVSKSDDFAIVKCSENFQNELKSASTLAVLYETILPHFSILTDSVISSLVALKFDEAKTTFATCCSVQ